MGKTRDTGFLTDCVFTDSSNNVGVGGAPSGSFKFEVTGTGKFSGLLTGLNYRATTTSTGGYFQSWDGTNEADFGSWKSIIGSGNAYDALIYSSNASSGFYVMTGGSTTPKLTIASTGAATFSSTLTTGGTIQITGAGSPTTGAGLEMGYGNFTAGRTTITSYNRTGAAYVGNDYNALDYIWYTSGTSKMALSNGGELQIGPASNQVRISSQGTFASTTLNAHIINADGTGAYSSGDLLIQPRSYSGGGANNIVFGTSNNTNTATERMRITSGGYFKASNNGTYLSSTGSYHEIRQTTSSQNLCIMTNAGSDPYGIDISYPNASPNNTTNNFLYCPDSTAIRAVIRSNGGLANFQANNVNLSDERTKKDIIPLESYWDKFKAIEIVKFKYNDQTHDDFNIGVIAQQVEKVAPEFVDIDGWDTKPKLDEEGNEIPSDEEPLKSIYTADLHHATIKVLQEAMAKIEELESKVSALENR